MPPVEIGVVGVIGRGAVEGERQRGQQARRSRGAELAAVISAGTRIRPHAPAGTRVIQLDDPVDEVDVGEQVRDDDDAEALAGPARDVLPEADVGAVVEALIGLVEQQHAGAAEQRSAS